jgi:hypothetical protein
MERHGRARGYAYASALVLTLEEWVMLGDEVFNDRRFGTRTGTAVVCG